MNMTTLISIIIALIIGGAVGTSVINQEPVENTDSPASIDYVSLRPELSELPSEDISIEEREGLVFMREEEKLARDVYITLYEKWGVKIFSNISQSEQTHTEAIRDLLVKYNISDPVNDDTVGVFTNNELGELYDTLVSKGEVSVEEALVVGAIIEDLDIFDLQKYISQVDNKDIILVYENLLRGSRNHLRSFISQLESRGESYTPQYITQTEFDEILSSTRETGNDDRGWGKKK